jgi:mannose-6-phosphate isomerase-like protein (cupin superfamily)
VSSDIPTRSIGTRKSIIGGDKFITSQAKRNAFPTSLFLLLPVFIRLIKLLLQLAWLTLSLQFIQTMLILSGILLTWTWINAMQAQIINTPESDEYYFEEGCFILELSNSAQDPQLSIARARVKAGMSTRLHRLLGKLVERYIIISGQGRVEIGDLPAQRVSAGNVVIIPPLCSQKITNTGEQDLVFLALCTPRFEKQFYEDIDN